MSNDQLHGESMLSSISNISVKIDHTEIDDPGFFKHNHIHSIDHEQDCAEVNIDDVMHDDQDIDHASLVNQIYFRYKAQHIGNQITENNNGWVSKKDMQGLSEAEIDSQHNANFLKTNINSQPVQIKHLHQPKQKPSPIKKRRVKQQQRLLKNQTKNIPKNYGKAIITFIEKYESKVCSILEKMGVSYEEFMQELRNKKPTINTIADLRSMWLDYRHAAAMRVLSNLFLRKYSLSYIFNSRICNYGSHIKYRYRLYDAIKEPVLFKHIKDY